MSYLIYLSLKGKKQGLISAGCSTPESIGNRYQAGREDQIQVLSLNHMMTRDQNVNHHPVSFVKPIDKSSPLLAMAIDGNELLDAVFMFYRISPMGQLERFYEVKLTSATLVDFSCHYPHSIGDNDQIPSETVLLDYKSITCSHLAAGTIGYSISQLQGREEKRPLLSGFSSILPLAETITALFSHQFKLKNQQNGDNCQHIAYGVKTNNGSVEGVCQTSGVTKQFDTKQEENLNVEYLFQTKIGI
ncbi:Hcp family type VI secretion system effector [Xenorhabdus bovienii]|uniref:Hcp family type VI secretion system effector n=1 Tax=Xenorhabdus bovienii TaxID=40576 RepID=UPI0023B2EC35|nr:Hcp family type VI secretion system effector [Xenorhabdus bovienii]MDE9462491.1 Hcp family type VI secretion system effector [Xenorhabdus bovienii]MDE9470420.1 Hcp family type VI secretion system effector [Xenorhabdus bovienii]